MTNVIIARRRVSPIRVSSVPAPNSFNYWMRNGAIMLPTVAGGIATSGNFDYWLRDGAIMFPSFVSAGKN
jgi:hypothetical protein